MKRILAVLPLALIIASPAIGADWPMYGHDIRNSRFNSGETAISVSNAGTLAEAWFFPTGGPVSATPAVVNGVVYAGSWDHNFYALDAVTGGLKWKIALKTPQGDSEGPFPGIQSSALIANSRVYFGDSCGYLHAYAANGSGAPPKAPAAFTTRHRGCASNGTEAAGFPIDLAAALPGSPDPNSGDAPHTDIFSSPVPFTPTAGPNKGRKLIYIGAASHVDRPCIHGALFAIDALSGKIVWRFDTVPLSAIGGAVWSTPAVDAANDLVYIDTGDCVNNASQGFSESIIALDASCSGVSVDGSCPNMPAVGYPPNAPTPGNPVWFFQAHPNGEIADLDFGSSPNIITDASGRSVLVGGGSKDGTYYAVKAGRGAGAGALVWKTAVSAGGPTGGFSGSTGFAYSSIFGTTVDGPIFEVSLNAFGPSQSNINWTAADQLGGFSPVGIANGLVFAGDTAGNFIARDRTTGKQLFFFPTQGGIGSGAAVAEGAVFVGSGENEDAVEKTGVWAFRPR